jgi:hypothetical protein
MIVVITRISYMPPVSLIFLNIPPPHGTGFGACVSWHTDCSRRALSSPSQQENVKTLLEHLGERHGEQLAELGKSVDVFQKVLTRYEQAREAANMGRTGANR